MSDPYVAEIRMFAGNYAPQGWAFCNGQTLAISQNTALFSLLGTTYGGDGRSTFALPNLQGMAPLQAGQGSGLSRYALGQTGGESTVTLGFAQMPSHSHVPMGSNGGGTQDSPGNGVWTLPSLRRGTNAYSVTGGSTPMANNILAQVGGGQPHDNMMPYVVLNYCIALQGIFPQRP